MVTVRDAAPEMVRKAFKQAQTERPGRDVHRAPRGRRRARDRRHPAPVNVPRDPDALRRPGPPGGRTSWRRRGTRSCSRAPGVARDGAMAALRRFSERPADPGRDDVPGQGRVPRRPPARAGHDRLHGEGLRELRVRPRRRRGGGRLRPRGVRAGPLEPARRQADHPRPPDGRRGRRELHAWRSGSRGRSASPSTRSPTAATSTRSGGDVPPVKRAAARGARPRRRGRRVPARAGAGRGRHPRGDGPRRTSCSPTRAPRRCGWRASIPPTSRTPA